MEYPRALLEQLGALRSDSWSGKVFRWTFEGTSPDRANSRGGRWNPPGVSALYTSFSREIVLAESDYLIEAQSVAPERARQVHTLSLSLRSALEITDVALLARLGIDDETLKGIDYSQCQLVGGAVERLGRDGLIVPSARAPGNNLVIFVNRLPYGEPLVLVMTETLKDRRSKSR
jgi:RES domain-containing protein